MGKKVDSLHDCTFQAGLCTSKSLHKVQSDRREVLDVTDYKVHYIVWCLNFETICGIVCCLVHGVVQCAVCCVVYLDRAEYSEWSSINE